MKKNLLTLALTCLTLAQLRAAVLYQEKFPYTNGPITVTGTNANGTTNWFSHSGLIDNYVNNGRLEVGSGGMSPGRSGDVNRPFTSQTNAITPLYASFIVNVTNLPNANGAYFAHYFVNGTTFYGRVWALTGNCGGTSNVFCALPGTFRLGVSAQSSGSPSRIFPVDLAMNTDYQVVIYYDPNGADASLAYATLWVNPMNASDQKYTATDNATTTNILRGFAFRQASTVGSFFTTASNLVVATTFDEAATNVWASNSIPPYVVQNPQSTTNFVGDNVSLVSIANGQGFYNFNYQWRKNGGNVANPNGNNNVFSIASAVIGDTGNYDVVVSNTLSGLSATSAVAFLWITNPPVPPNITPTTNSTVTAYYHSTVTLTTVITGPNSPTAQWYYNNTLLNDGPNISGSGSDTLTISDLFTNNSTAGAYYCQACNIYGCKTSGVFTVTGVAPPAVSIAFLRTLVDPVNYTATNASLRYQITGIVTTSTNLTSSDTSSYYLQDSSGCGINIFTTHGLSFRPNQGDVVTFVGWLSSFNSNLELESDTADPTTSRTVWSNNVAGLPPQKVIPMNITNNLAFCETNLEGSIVMLTNVYFGTNAGRLVSTNANFTVTVTNANGDSFILFFSPQDLDTTNRELPSFAYTVAGPMVQDLGNSSTPRNAGYELTVTRWADIVTTPLTVADSHSGNTTILTWQASPYTYAYSVQTASSANGPFTATVSSNLHFTDANGTYTDPNASADQKFYRISTP